MESGKDQWSWKKSSRVGYSLVESVWLGRVRKSSSPVESEQLKSENLVLQNNPTGGRGMFGSVMGGA